MDVSTVAAIVVALLDFYIGARYCVKLFRQESTPRIATWIIFEIGVVGDVSGRHDYLAMVYQLRALVPCWLWWG